MAVKGVLFDLDGTLVDSVQDMYMALNLTLTEVAFPIVTQSQVRTWVGNGIDVLVKRGLSGDFEINPHLSETLVCQATDRFYSHYQALVGEYALPFEHVNTGLLALSHLPKAIVTNKNRLFTETLLNKLSLTHHFTTLICGDDCAKKPSSEPLIKACEAMNVAPSDVMMVGDSKSDILAARNADMPVIAVQYGYHQGIDLTEFDPEYLCDGFLDIIPILNQH